MIDMPAKVRPHIVPRPAGQAELAPMIVVTGLTEHVDHAVDRRRAADHLAARIVKTPAIEARFGLRLEQPVSARVTDGKKIANRNMKPDPVVFAARLQLQHAGAGIGRKPISQDTPRRASTHNDIVELAFNGCRFRHSLPLTCSQTLPGPPGLARVTALQRAVRVLRKPERRFRSNSPPWKRCLSGSAGEPPCLHGFSACLPFWPH